MTVSKIAVMALVAVIAVPILLGYGLNLTETTESDYRLSGESVNVTPLIQNGTDYTTTHANIYQLNSNNFINSRTGSIFPLFENRTGTKSSLFMEQVIASNGAYLLPVTMSNFYYYNVTMISSSTTDYIKVAINYDDQHGNSVTYSINNFLDLSYDDSTKTLNYTYYWSGLHTGSVTSDRIDLTYTLIGNPGNYYESWYWKGVDTDTTPGYIDISSGFRMIYHDQTVTTGLGTHHLNGSILFPDNTISSLVTMDLSTITDPTYYVELDQQWKLEKATDGLGNVTWTVTDLYDPANTAELFYDQSQSSNTYQLYKWIDLNGRPSSTPGDYDYDFHYDFRYVGGWPTAIGKANYYLNYDLINVEPRSSEPNFKALVFFDSTITPVMRVDDAVFRAFEYPVIENNTYTPVNFRSNPATTISNVEQYGSALDFGGNTYTVTDGNITISGHKIPVNGLVLSSVPNGSGTYDNKIGNTVISTTAQPSTITFHGKWSASISTDSMESYTYTHTEWVAGSFGWDGIDQNFLIVGLITCLGVFIGLGIYARKRGSGGIIPLMIVTGCAAAVFFILL